ncbi:MAG: nucleotidyltransferase family protein [Bacteroidetes bacterium]|nr:nucleotidyltransferase family protein [Bacteroidota bacterium]
MSCSTAIVLAGGLGTRLRSVVSDLPKCMAPVNSRPFIDNVIRYLLQYKINHFVFSVGYKADAILNHIQTNYPELNITFAIEEEPLGTGGAIRYAMREVKEDQTFVLNGDTIFETNLDELNNFHHSVEADCTLALKPMRKFDRYGVVATDTAGKVIGFQEKKYYESGLINGGIYLIEKENFIRKSFPKVFSFEKDYLEKYLSADKIYGYTSDAFFIDIGIPEDYQRAQQIFHD